MRKINIDKNIKCDTVLCHNIADIMIETDSYKGNTFLCKSCFYGKTYTKKLRIGWYTTET